MNAGFIAHLEEQVKSLQLQLDILHKQLEAQKANICSQPQNTNDKVFDTSRPKELITSENQLGNDNNNESEAEVTGSFHVFDGQQNQFTASDGIFVTDSALFTASNPNPNAHANANICHGYQQVSSGPNVTDYGIVSAVFTNSEFLRQADADRDEDSNNEYRPKSVIPSDNLSIIASKSNKTNLYRQRANTHHDSNLNPDLNNTNSHDRLEIMPGEKTMPLHFKVENLLKSIREVVQDDPMVANRSDREITMEESESQISVAETNHSCLEQDLLKTINDALDQPGQDYLNDNYSNKQGCDIIPSVIFEAIPRAIFPSVLNDYNQNEETTTLTSTANFSRDPLTSTFLASMNEQYSMASLEYLKKHKLLSPLDDPTTKRKKDPVSRVLDMEKLESLYRKSNK